MDLARGNAHLRSKAIHKAVGKAGGHISVHPRAIHPLQEFRGGRVIPSHNAIRMVGAMAVDMVYGRLQGVHHANGQDQVQVFRVPVRLCGRVAGNQRSGCLVAAELDALGLHGLRQGRQEGLRHIPMHQQGFHGVAHGDVLGFAVHGHPQGHVQVGVLVHVHMADAVRMAQHGDAAVVHNPADKGIAAPGDNQIDEGILLEHGAHIFPGFQ